MIGARNNRDASFFAGAILASIARCADGGSSPAHAATASLLVAAVRRDVVAELSNALRHRYVFPDVGERAAVRNTTTLTAGDYDSLADRAAFIERLSADVQAIARDKHLNIMSALRGQRSAPGLLAMPLSEAGLTRADKLAGGIGYIDVIGFPPGEAFKPVVDRAMEALRGSRGLIVDVRRNSGDLLSRWPISSSGHSAYP